VPCAENFPYLSKCCQGQGLLLRAHFHSWWYW
jgi:hypothetical protein